MNERICVELKDLTELGREKLCQSICVFCKYFNFKFGVELTRVSVSDEGGVMEVDIDEAFYDE